MKSFIEFVEKISLLGNFRNLCLVHEQRRAFEAQLKLAAKWLKPIVIHSRDAYEETFKLMKQVHHYFSVEFLMKIFLF